jgi:hypothetical protein
MNLLQRYVAAVKRHLPREKREDVGAEIQSSLADSLDALEEANGRPLTDVEIAAVLKRRGHPLQVAAAYNSTRVMISPRSFPLYTRVLATAFVALAGGMLASTLFGRPGMPALSNLGDALHDLYWIALSVFAWVTLFFFFFDSWMERGNFFRRWDPSRLPPARREDVPASPAAGVADIVLGVLMASFAESGAWLPGRLLHVDDPLGLRIDESWQLLQWPLRLALVALIAAAALNLLQRYWSRSTLLLHLGGHAIAGLILLVVALAPGSLQAGLASAAAPAGQLESLLYTARFLVLLFALRSLYLAASAAPRLSRLAFADERPVAH